LIGDLLDAKKESVGQMGITGRGERGIMGEENFWRNLRLGIIYAETVR
jgi:hypothetical protein